MNLIPRTLQAATTGAYIAIAGATIGCGSSPTPYSFGPATDSGGPDVTVSSSGGSGSSGGSSSSGGGGSSSGGSSCVTSCTSDLDCQNSCPAVSGGGSNCCDVTSKNCYMSSASVCPSQPDASGE